MHHCRGLRQLLAENGTDDTDAEKLIHALQSDFRQANLDSASMALLVYAEKLTKTPGEIGAGDIEPLAQAGFDDRAIHDACAITAYFAFVNRIADGLGVELETTSEGNDP